MLRLACLAVIASLVPGAGALGDSAFTYQGELSERGVPANGVFDMSFSIWDVQSSGNQLGNVLPIDNINVVEGRFTAELDFRPEVFGDSSRWLEIEVDGFTLSPRNEITRSPYSVQTRGIYVDEDRNVFVGEEDDPASLIVNGGVTSLGPGGGSFGTRNPNNVNASFSLGWINNLPRIRIGGSGNGAGTGFDIQTVGNRSLIRALHSGYVGINDVDNPQSALEVNGDGMFYGRVGVGRPSSLLGQLTVVDSGHGAAFGVDVEWDSNSFPAIYAANSGRGGGIWAVGNSDVEPEGGGLIVSGDPNGFNIGIDNNEIMARANGQTATLYLNADGGDVRMGANQIKPPLAYGLVSRDGTVLSASPNVTGVTHIRTGQYNVVIEGGIAGTDILLANCREAHLGFNNIVSAGHDDGNLRVHSYNAVLERTIDTQFCFVVYRP